MRPALAGNSRAGRERNANVRKIPKSLSVCIFGLLEQVCSSRREIRDSLGGISYRGLSVPSARRPSGRRSGVLKSASKESLDWTVLTNSRVSNSRYPFRPSRE